MVLRGKNPWRNKSKRDGYVFFLAKSPDAPTTKTVKASSRYPQDSSSMARSLRLLTFGIDMLSTASSRQVSYTCLEKVLSLFLSEIELLERQSGDR